MTALKTLLTRDAFVIYRSDGGSDAEGNPVTTWHEVGQYKGTWGSPSGRDQEIAARADEVIEAVVAGSFPAYVGDKLVDLRGDDWIVVMSRPLVTHRRYFLRKVR